MVDRTKYKITVQNERFRIETIRKAEKAKREAENDRNKRSKLRNAKLGEVFEQVQRDFPLMEISCCISFKAEYYLSNIVNIYKIVCNKLLWQLHTL